MIAILDYDAGNMKSVEKALKFLGQESVVTHDRKEILAADKVILPGVGAFGIAMENLKKYELDKIIKEVVEKKTPFLGICLGMQLLFDGEIVKIPDAPGLKIPHIGWNSLQLQNDGRLFQGIPQEAFVYFVHSYYLRAREESIVKAVTEYGVTIHASVEKENVFACQFHPEKSSSIGLKMLENFTKIGEV